MTNRDDFTKRIKETLAKRVGFHCSNPSCKIITSGPHENKLKSTNIGIAAHITAAAAGGPRFNEKLTLEERKDISNGIWLCIPCSNIIDKDPDRFPVELLKKWKEESEEYTRNVIDGQANYIPPLVLQTLEDKINSQINLINNKDQIFNELKEKYISLNKSLHERSNANPIIEKSIEELNKGNFENAEKLLLEDIENNNNRNAKSYYDIGNISELQIDYKKALKYYKSAVAINNNSYLYLNSLARVHYLIANYNDAIESYKQILSINLNTFGENNEYTAKSYNDIGLLYHSLGDYDYAIENSTKALNINLNILNENHPNIAANYNMLAGTYEMKGNYEKSIELNKKSLEILINTVGEEHIDTATSYNNLGTAYYSNNDYDNALECHNKALTIYKSKLGKNHQNIASSYSNIGVIYYSKEEYDKAIGYYNKSLSINKSVLGENHPNTADRKSVV